MAGHLPYGIDPKARRFEEAHDASNLEGESPRCADRAQGAVMALRAALNLAVQNRRVGADRAIEWRLVKQHSHAEGRRDLFLDLDQRRRLIGAAGGAVGDLIAGIALTGARPGDLRKARRSQFDSRTAAQGGCPHAREARRTTAGTRGKTPSRPSTQGCRRFRSRPAPRTDTPVAANPASSAVPARTRP